MKKYIEYLKSSTLAKVTGILLVIIFITAIYDIMLISTYISLMPLILVTVVSLIILVFLFFFCTIRKIRFL